MTEETSNDPTSETAAMQHALMRASAPYQAQLAELDSLTQSFVHMLGVTGLASRRDVENRNWLFWRFVDDLLASAVGIALLVREGIHNPARRELRFMLELVIRNLYVDTVFASRATPLATRLAYVEHQLGQRDIELLPELRLALIGEPDEFKQTTRLLYGELSGYTHPSHDQLARQLELAERGVYIGFETPVEVEAFNSLLRRTYDILLVYLFEALGPSSTGDVFVQVLDELPNWPFGTTQFVPLVSRNFDYKLERQQDSTESDQ